MADFTIDVPINASGSTAGAVNNQSNETKKEESTKKLEGTLKGLTKAVTVGNVFAKILGEALKSLSTILTPILRVLNVLFLVVLMPLMPYIIELSNAIADLAGRAMEAGGGLSGVSEAVGEKWFSELGGMAKTIGALVVSIILGVVVAVGLVILAGVALIPALIVGAIVAIVALIVSMWDEIVAAFQTAGQFFIDVWNNLIEWIVDIKDRIVEAWTNMINGIEELWSNFKQSLSDAWNNFVSWISDLGEKIWDIIKTPFEWLGSVFKKMVNGIIDLANKIPGVNIPRLASGGIVSSPTTAVIGEAGPEAVIPLSKMGSMGSSVTINNPVVRSDADITKLANQVSKAMQRSLSGRISRSGI